MEKCIEEYAVREQEAFMDGLSRVGDYKPMTTFFKDLSVAEFFGKQAISSAFDSMCDKYLKDYKYYTELVLCLNWKAWEWDARGDVEYSDLYSELYYMADERFCANYEHDETALDYYFQVTD